MFVHDSKPLQMTYNTSIPCIELSSIAFTLLVLFSLPVTAQCNSINLIKRDGL